MTAETAPITEWITSKDAAKIAGYSEVHMTRLANAKLVISEKRGRDWWYLKADVERLAAERKGQG